MALQVQYLLLADDVQELQRGKVNILGTFDQVFMPELPAVYRRFKVVVLLTAGSEDELGQHTVAFRLVRPNGQLAGEAGGAIKLTPAPGGWLSSARLILDMVNMTFREYGRHQIEVVVDGKGVARHPLTISRPPSAA